MKQTLRKTFALKALMLVAMLVGGFNGAWAEEEVYKTALFGSNYNSQSVGSYTTTWSATNDGFTVTLANFNNNNNQWEFVKCGRKNNASVASITTSEAIDKAITKVAVTIDAITAAKVNSIKLYTSSDNSNWTEAGSFPKATTAQEVVLASPTANLYYQIEFDCASGSSNGLVTVSKVEYYYNTGGASAPTISADNVDIAYDATNGAIAYTVNNPVTGGRLTASTTADWLTLSSETASPISFTCSANESNERSATVTLTYAYNSETVTKNVIVTQAGNPNGPGSENNPYTVAQARAAIDAGTGLTDVYATGIISQIDSYNTNYKSITYWISSDGTTTSDQLEVYSGKGLNGADFSSKDDLAVGATVIVYGTLKKYGDTYEFDKNNYLTSYTAPTVAVEQPTFLPAGGTYTEAQTVYISTATDGANILYSYDCQEWKTDYSDKGISVTETTTIYAKATKDGEESAVATATYTIKDPNGPGTQNNPYTVAQAIAFINTLGTATSDEVYVSGIISQVDKYNSNYSSITYWISDDGTTTTQMQVYSGKGLDGADFSGIDDLQVGDVVTVKGNVKLFTSGDTSTPEFDKNNELVAFNRPAVTTPTITATPTSLTGFTYLVGNGPSAAQQITIGGSNLTNSWGARLDDNSNFEFSFSETSEYFSDSSIGANPSEPNQTVTIYVRMKSGLEVGDYTGAITITSQGAETVTVNLSGSVTAPEAANVTWDLSTNSYAEATDDIVTWTSNFATMTNAVGTGTTKPNNYLGGDSNNRTSSRFYNGNILTITPAAGYTITSVVFEATSTNYAGALGGSDWTNATASVSGTTVTVTPENGVAAVSAAIGGTCGFTSVKVYYTAAAPIAPVWSALPAPEITIGETYELNLANYVSGYPVPAITIERGGDIANFENNILSFTPTVAGTYDFIFKAENSEGSVEETLSILVNAPVGTIEVSETTISVSSSDQSSGTIDVTYNNITNQAPYFSHEQFYDADDNPLTANPASDWITVGMMEDNNIYYSIKEENTSSEPRSVYFRIWAPDDNNENVSSELITITQAGYVDPNERYEIKELDFTVNDWGLPAGTSNKTVEENTYNNGFYSIKVAGSTNNGYYFSTVYDNHYLMLGKSGAYLTLPAFDTSVQKIQVVGNSQASGNTLQNIYVDDEAVSTQTKGADVTNTYEIASAYQAAGNQYTLKILSAHNSQIKQVLVYTQTGATYTRENLTIGNYGTICLPFNADVEGATLYTIASKTDTYITLQEVTSAEAGVPYIFCATATTLTATYTSAATTRASENDYLVGTIGGMNVPEGAYVISNNKVVLCGTGCKINDHRAYIKLNGDSNVKEEETEGAVKLYIGGSADGINSINNAQNGAVIYDLAGRRVNAAKAGLYIVNGKKVAVK